MDLLSSTRVKSSSWTSRKSSGEMSMLLAGMVMSVSIIVGSRESSVSDDARLISNMSSRRIGEEVSSPLRALIYVEENGGAVLIPSAVLICCRT